MILILVATSIFAGAQSFEKFKPARDVAPMDSPSLFGKATRVIERDLTDCKYVIDQTRVGVFQQSQFCNGIPIKFCFARIACASHKTLIQKPYGEPAGKTTDHSCPAVDGKCPANAEDCMKTEGFLELTSGRAAIAGAPATSGGGSSTTGQ